MTHSGELSAPHHPPFLQATIRLKNTSSARLKVGLDLPRYFERGRKRFKKKKKPPSNFTKANPLFRGPRFQQCWVLLGGGWGGEEEREKKNHLAGPERGEIQFIIEHFQQQSIKCFENNALVPALKARPSGRL